MTSSSHSHVFGQDLVRTGERRTAIVVVITAVMMIIEIICGILFGSMALLADGLHMASHAAALGVTVAAYVLARKYARDLRFSFGTGKLNSLAAFTSAIMLAMVAGLMAIESGRRLLHPVEIAFNQAIFVAVVGLIVNLVSMFILGGHHERNSHHHQRSVPSDSSLIPHPSSLPDHHHDHSLRAAYIHVLADALTSVLAIVALLSAKYLDAHWMDPMMGILGAILVARWSWTLVRTSARVLLDRQAPENLLSEIRQRIESNGNAHVLDLHVWSIGPGIYAADISLHTDSSRPASEFRSLLPDNLGLVHVTVEVNPR